MATIKLTEKCPQCGGSLSRDLLADKDFCTRSGCGYEAVGASLPSAPVSAAPATVATTEADRTPPVFMPPTPNLESPPSAEAAPAPALTAEEVRAKTEKEYETAVAVADPPGKVEVEGRACPVSGGDAVLQVRIPEVHFSFLRAAAELVGLSVEDYFAGQVQNGLENGWFY